MNAEEVRKLIPSYGENHPIGECGKWIANLVNDAVAKERARVAELEAAAAPFVEMLKYIPETAGASLDGWNCCNDLTARDFRRLAAALEKKP